MRQPPSDRQLLIAAAAGDEAAFTALYQRYALPLREYFARALPSDLETDDLVQQVFIQLLGSKAFRQPQEGPDQLNALLFTIAKNLLRNQARKERRRGERETVYLRLTATAEFSPPHPGIDAAQFDAAILQLPDHQRQCILLRYRHGLDVAGIAELINCAPGTVKSRLHYGLKKLSSLLNHPTS
ncbi:RNA polymerase sigma factor [Lewinella sp. IMCC34191]|uniref:RNA polymerase sigma factor n=1 Tax=Lewinella sp. IMCC34191 TaxID=2259172 RepID=UPI000E270EC3|nr:sigma-70 family RNA polymerase sigma factor [Lewinella sp. IMCC34191]